ncbi:MAG: hypothetical protein ACUVWP_05435 [bacterium]
MNTKKGVFPIVLSIMIISIVIPFTIVNCTEEKTQNESSKTEEKIEKTEEGIITFTGTIIYNPIEGGFYGITSDDGNNYEPINLDDKFKVEGLKVKVKAIQKTDWVSISMWGTIIEILKIEKL